MALTLFELLDALYSKRYLRLNATEREVESATKPFMVARWASMNPRAFNVAAAVGRYAGYLPDDVFYTALAHALPPLRAAPRVGYIKKPKTADTTEFDPVALRKLGRLLCCSTEHARQSAYVLRHAGVDVNEYFGIAKRKRKAKP